MKTDQKHLKEIQNAISFIEENLKESISVDDVCAKSSISPWQFQRLFRLYTGDSIGNYLRSRRLTCSALELAQQPSLRILDIAIDYQFGSHEAFTRSFKKMFAVTPTEADDHQAEIRLKFKLPLTEKQLLHNLEGIQREPEFKNFSSRSFVGVDLKIPSPFSENIDYIKLVSDLWRGFNTRRKEITNRYQGVGYGLVLSPSGSMIEDHFPYMACVEIDPRKSALVPPQMRQIEIISQEYATFDKRGLADFTRLSLDYIYGFWLPQSGYRRAQGYDIEIYDHRLRLDRPDSISTYCIPVVKA